jgi:hypothetical protein
MLANLPCHLLTALIVMRSNLWFILAHANTVAVRFALYTGGILWGIEDFFFPSLHFTDISRLLSISVFYVSSFLLYVLPACLVIYGTVSLLALLLKYESRALTLISSGAGAFLFTIALNLEMVIHHLLERTFMVEVPLWYAALLAWWILIGDITKGGANGN